MGAAARKLVRERFSWTTVAAQLDAIYAGMAEMGGAKHRARP